MANIYKIQLPNNGGKYDLRDSRIDFMSTPGEGDSSKVLTGAGTWVNLTGITFNIAWDGTGTPVASKIPAGVVVSGVTGTLAASSAVDGCFYLIKSESQAGQKDVFDEYVVVDKDSTKQWEKIGDTTVSVSLNKTTKYLTASATGAAVTLATTGLKATATQGDVTDPTITVTPTTTNIKATAGKPGVTVATKYIKATSSQPTLTVPTINVTPSTANIKATSSGGGYASPTTDNVLGEATTFSTSVTPSTTKLSASASGGGVAWNSKDTKTVLTGVKISNQGSVALAEDTASTPGTGSFQVATGIASASAAGGGAAWNSKDEKTVLLSTAIGTPGVTLTANDSTSTGRITYVQSVTGSLGTDVAVGADGTAAAITGFGAHTTKNVLGTSTPFTTTVSGGGYASPNTDTFIKDLTVTKSNKLATDTVYSKSSGGNGTTVTANKSTWTFSIGTGDDATTLIIGGGNGSDVSANLSNWAFTSKTVATGSVSGTGTGDAVVTDVTYAGTGQTATAVTGLGSQSSYSATTTATTSGTGADVAAAITALGTPTTANALTGVKVTTQPTVTITPTTKYLSAAVTGLDNTKTATVVGTSSTFTNTQPTITVNPTLKYVKATPSGITAASDGTASVIGSSATLSHTNPSVTIASGATGDVTVATGISSATTTAATSGPGADVVSVITGLGSQTAITTNLTSDGTAGATGVVTVATGISSATATGGSVSTPTITLAAGQSTDTGAVTVGAPGAVAADNITAPTVSLATGAAAGSGVISVATGITSASASGTAVGAPTVTIATDTTGDVTVATGTVSATTQPTITLTSSGTTSSGAVTYVEDVSLS